jgi:NADH-quinone oxidoreductase subunit L
VNNQTIQLLTILVPGLPLLGFLIHVLFGSKISKSIAGIHGSLWPILSFVICCVLFGMVSSGSALDVHLFDWFQVGDVNIPFAFLIDRLSISMLLIISGIGALIHIYSVGYMHDDEGFNRFFSYLNLFIFFMMILVMANNYVLMFVGWEGVGLCSYLLIGFWFSNNEYNAAARKAFVMNRIGDLALVIGLILIAKNYGTLTFSELLVSEKLAIAGAGTIGLITLLLFAGATGKSAQIPLFTWLPDAMAGPTPVSALIHAATMVTAGIYLIVRSNALFSMAPMTLDLILYTGLITAIVAGTIAIKQNDIKKVLAYSTVSQLGLMFFALGLGAYEAAFFHLVTHAFFKALLFLGAGSVIHGMSGEQDMTNMGGLRSSMKWTHILVLIGVLAIIALPPFAGFFSKDNILAAAYMRSPILWGIGLLSGLITVFYMMRMYFLTFWGANRASHEVQHHIHESPMSMTLPMTVLAILSVVGGMLNVPELFHGHKSLMNFLSPVVPIVEGHHLDHSTEWTMIGVSVAAILAVIAIAYNMYVSKGGLPVASHAENSVGDLLQNKYYLDDVYDGAIGQPAKYMAGFLDNTVEQKVIDGTVNGVGSLSNTLSSITGKLQSGYISHYIIAMAIGMTLFLLYFILF